MNIKWTKKDWILIGILILSIGVLSFLEKDDLLQSVGKEPYSIGAKQGFFKVYTGTIIYTWICMGFIIWLAKYWMKELKDIPDRRQASAELFYETFLEMVKDSFGKKAGYAIPLILTLPLFILTANWMGTVPLLESPTGDINTTVAMALIVFLYSHGSSVYYKGFWGWIKSFFEPAWFMFPLNVIGEIAKPISHSMRLFGNIFGGGVLVIVLSELGKNFVFPVVLNGYFGLVSGLIQTLVFTLLSIAYISVHLPDEVEA